MSKSLIYQIIGLMFSKPRNMFFVLPHSGRVSIHSFFVFFPFDAVYLDEYFRVVEVIPAIKPFTLNVTNKEKVKYLLEIGTGEKLNVGDYIAYI